MICAATARLTAAARLGAGSTGTKPGFVPSIPADEREDRDGMRGPNSNRSCAKNLQCLARTVLPWSRSDVRRPGHAHDRSLEQPRPTAVLLRELTSGNFGRFYGSFA